MKLLAFDTSTELMSVAVQDTLDGTPRIWQHSGPGGALTSASLIPCIERLMAQAQLRYEQLDAIAFGSGPGSFTGLRTACAVAQGLAFGANVPVLPIDTLLAVAEEARHQQGAGLAGCQVLALLDARMDEMYVAGYAFDRGHWRQTRDDGLVRPEDLVYEAHWLLAGNVFAAYGARLPGPRSGADAGQAPSVTGQTLRIAALPCAGALLRLAPALLAAGAAVRAEQALPRYIRDKVAKTTQERAAEQAAARA